METAIKAVVDALKALVSAAKPEDLTAELKAHVRAAVLSMDLGMIEADEQRELDAAVPPSKP